MLCWMFLREDRREMFDPRKRVLLTGKEYKYPLPRITDHVPTAFETIQQALSHRPGNILCRVEIPNPVLLFAGGVCGDKLKVVSSANVYRWLNCLAYRAAEEVMKYLPEPQNPAEGGFHTVMKQCLEAKDKWLEDSANDPAGFYHCPNGGLLPALDAFLTNYSNWRRDMAGYWLYYLTGKAMRYLMSGVNFDDRATKLHLLPDLLCQVYAYGARLARSDEDSKTEDYIHVTAKERLLDIEYTKDALGELERRSRYVEAA